MTSQSASLLERLTAMLNDSNPCVKKYLLYIEAGPPTLKVQTHFRWSFIAIDVLRLNMHAALTVLNPRKLQQSYLNWEAVLLVDNILSSVAKKCSAQMDWSAFMLFLALTAHTTCSATSFFYLMLTIASALDADSEICYLHYDKVQRWVPSCSKLTTYFIVYISSILNYEAVVSFNSSSLINTVK